MFIKERWELCTAFESERERELEYLITDYVDTAEWYHYTKEEAQEFEEGFMNREYGWDPAEYDSYEEWLELNRFDDFDRFSAEIEGRDEGEIEFSSREEYKDFVIQHILVKEARVTDYYKLDLEDYEFELSELESKIQNLKFDLQRWRKYKNL